jgi:hypothetical protein
MIFRFFDCSSMAVSPVHRFDQPNRASIFRRTSSFIGINGGHRLLASDDAEQDANAIRVK